MTKAEILEHFKDINGAYNECTRYDDLSRMIDELLEDIKEPCVGSDECKEVIKAYFDGQADKWIPINEDDPTTFPEVDKYVLLSFSNFTLPYVGRYEEDKNGGKRRTAEVIVGSMYFADSKKTESNGFVELDEEGDIPF